MKKFAILILILLFTAGLKINSAQAPDWTRLLQTNTFGFQSADVVTADAESVYMAAGISGPITFEGASFTTIGFRDLLLSKINNSGTAIWTKQFNADVNGSIFPNAIITDASGNIYLSCAFTGNVTIGGSTVASDLLVNSFFAKFDSNGNGIWATAFASNGNGGSKIALDDNGNLYLIGRSSKLIKFNSSGTILWEQSYTTQTLQAIAVYGTNLYIGGTLQSPSTTFGTITLNALGGYNTGFLLKANLDGVYSSSMVVGGSTTQDGSSVSNIVMDNTGNLIITGAYTENLVLGSITINNTASAGQNYTYIAKCDNSFNFYWAKSSTQYVNANREMRNYRLFTDNLNNIYEYGAIASPFQYGSVSVDPNNGQFLVRFDSDGNAINAYELQNTLPNKVYVTPAGKVLTVGSYNYPGAANYGNLYFNQFSGDMTPEWQKIGSGLIQSGTVTHKYIKHDASGNTYVQSRVIGYVDYFGTIINTNTYVTVISKLDINGNLLWMNQIADWEPSLFGPAFILDKDNNVLTVGLFKISLTIDTTTLTTDNTGFEGYVAKYSSAGALLWASKMNLDISVSPNITVASDNSGNVLVSGVISPANYLVKFDPFGNQLWEKSFQMESYYLSLITTDADNNIYLTSEIHLSDATGSATIGSVILNQTYNDGSTVLVKFDPDGNALWAKTYGGVMGAAYSDGWPTDIKTDADGNTYLWGWCVNNAVFGEYTLSNPIGAGYSFFLSKINTSGDIVWAKAVHEKTTAFNYGSLLDIDKLENVYVGGHFRGIISIDGALFSPEGSNDFFVAKYSDNGTFQWIKTIPSGSNIINAISVYNNDVLTLAGSSGLNTTLGTFPIVKKGGSSSIIATLGEIISYHEIASTKIFSLIGTAFYKNDGVTLGNWDYDMDFTYVGTSGNISTYELKNQLILQNGEFKIRKDHLWNESWGPDEMPILGDPGNFIKATDGPNFKTLTGKTYDMTFIVDWARNTYALLLNDGSQFVVTTSVTSIKTTSAFTTSEIFNEGIYPVTARGVCWSTTPFPTITNSKTSDGQGIGGFASYLTGLNVNSTYYVRAYATNSGGTFYGNQITFNTRAECQSDFVYTFQSISGMINFTSSSQNATDYYWNFGDGNFSTLANPEYAYLKAGVFKVCLTIWNSTNGCQSVSCKDVIYAPVGEKYIVADFSFFTNPTNLTVSFSDLSTSNTTDWYWTMGDGKVMKTQNPVYTYSKPGVYTVCLTAIDKVNLLLQSVCKVIVVGEIACTIRSDFSYFINPSDLMVTFSSKASGSVTDYFWTFGDGSSSSLENPAHTYSTPGYYLVGLSVRNSTNKCMDMFTQFIQVGSVDCRAGFTFGVDPVFNTVIFSDDSKGNIDYYYWDFGDGTFSVLQNPVKLYKKAGIYLAGQTVIDNTNDCIDFYVQPVQVGEIDCSADFVSYIDPSTNTGYFTNKNVGEATALLWSFGDGRFSTQDNPVHEFSNGGIYSVGLNTFDFNSGCMDYYEEMLLIGELGNDCEADFIYILDPSNPEVSFKNKSIGDIVGSIWNFGDGSENSENTDPSHTFTKGGYHYVCLNVINSQGIRNMTCKWILVAGSAANDCRANFMFTVDSTTLEVKFVDNSFGNINKFTWDFGDSKTDSVSSVKDPSHIYSEKGYYLVQLRVENTVSGCVSNEYKLLNVAETQVLKAAFGYEAFEPDKKVAGYPVDLVSASSGDGATVEWDFGDKQVKKASFTVMDSTSGKVTHYYQLPGKYLVCLRVSDPISGQTDEFCSFVFTKNALKVDEIRETGLILDVYPNPLINYTTINFTLPDPQFVDMAIFDQLGRRIETLIKTKKESGNHQMIWETKNHPTGIYHLKLITPEKIITKQLVITR